MATHSTLRIKKKEILDVDRKNVVKSDACILWKKRKEPQKCKDGGIRRKAKHTLRKNKVEIKKKKTNKQKK